MINFEAELAKFKPSKEVSKVEEDLVKTDITDVQDILLNTIKDINKGVD